MQLNSKALRRQSQRERARQFRAAHPAYGIWKAIRRRCGLTNGASENERRNYLPKHLKMYEPWARSYEAFEHWAFANGWEPGMWVGRLDVYGDYVPENCVVCTAHEQVPRRDVMKGVNYMMENGNYAGMTGLRHSKETRQKISEKAKLVVHKTGWHHSPETRAKIAAANANKQHRISPEGRARIAESNKRRSKKGQNQ